MVNNKQRLSSLDCPIPIPASSLDSLDLSHLVLSPRPEFKYQLEDIPGLPIFKRNGKFKRFVSRLGEATKRIVSMPLLSNVSTESLSKDLPVLPNRCVTNYNTPSEDDLPVFNGSYGQEPTIERSMPVQSAPETPTQMLPTSTKTKYIVDDDDLDSLFSSNKSGSSEITEYSNQERETALSILDVVKVYEHTPTDSQSDIISIQSTIYTRDSRVSDISKDFLDEPQLGSLLEDDLFSVIDSLFGSESGSSTGNVNQTKQLPQLPTLDIKKSRNKINMSESNLLKPIVLNSPPSVSGRRPTSVIFEKPASSSKIYQRPASMMSYSNISMATCASTNSLLQAKAEMKNQVRQRPFSFCLDSPKDYNISRYTGPAKVRIASNPYKSSTGSTVKLTEGDKGKLDTTTKKDLPPPPPPKDNKRSVSMPSSIQLLTGEKQKIMGHQIASFLRKQKI